MLRLVVWTMGLLALAPALMAQDRSKDLPANPAAISAEQTAQLKEIIQKLAQLRRSVAQALAKIDYTEPNTADSSSPEPTEFVWIEDAVPAGANLQGDSPWEFVGKPHPVYSGEKSMRRTAKGYGQHFFTDARYGLKIGDGDRLFAYVYLDPENPPKTIMFQFNDGMWEHRAFWGDDSIPWGAANSPSRHSMGQLPKAGEWVRLDVAAAEVGLKPGAVLNGWAFTQHDGTVYWDQAGIVTHTPQIGQSFASLRAWEDFVRGSPESPLPPRVRAALTIEAATRNDAQTKLIRDYFLEHVYTKSRPTLAPLHQQIAALTRQRTELEAAQFRALQADFDASAAALLKAHREKSAGRFLEFAEQHGDTPAALEALMWVVTNATEATRVNQAIELVTGNHAESDALIEVCQRLANAPVTNGERLLHAVLEKSPRHDAQGWACFALAKGIAQREGSDDELQAEVDKLLERVVNEFADVRSFGGSVGQWQRSIGRIAPDIESEDIDGVNFKLSDYRGKVVVLDFWGHW